MSKLNIRRSMLATAVAAAGLFAGCASQSTPPPPRVSVPTTPGEGSIKTFAHLRPDPEPSAQDQIPSPPFDDAPIVTQAAPEEPAYLDAYARVGRPRVAVFVNRTIEGQIIPENERREIAGVEVTRETNAAVDMQTTRSSESWYGDRSTGSFKTTGPARLQESATVYLAPGQYDDVQAKAIDYSAIELALTDTLAAGGKVTVVSPTMARQRLSDEEVKDLQSGRPTMLREIAEKLDADVLIQAQARPTKQTAQGLEVRVLVEAINTRGGESVARAFVDVPPPLEKTAINRYTRFLARKMMTGLSTSWSTMATEPRPTDARDEADAARPTPATPPATRERVTPPTPTPTATPSAQTRPSAASSPAPRPPAPSTRASVGMVATEADR